MWQGPIAPMGRDDLEFTHRSIKTDPGSAGGRAIGRCAMKKDDQQMDPLRCDVEP